MIIPQALKILFKDIKAHFSIYKNNEISNYFYKDNYKNDL